MNRRAFMRGLGVTVLGGGKGLEFLAGIEYSFGEQFSWGDMAIPTFDDATVAFDSTIYTFDGGSLLGDNTGIGKIDAALLKDGNGRPARSALLFLVPGGTGVPIYSFMGDAWTGNEGLYLCTLDKVPLVLGLGSFNVNKPLRIDGYENIKNFRWALLTGTGSQQLVVQITYGVPDMGEPVGFRQPGKFYADELITLVPNQVFTLSPSLLTNDDGHGAQLVVIRLIGNYSFFTYADISETPGVIATSSGSANWLPFGAKLIVRGEQNIRSLKMFSLNSTQKIFCAYAA